MPNIYVEKEYTIFVEGKLDRLIFEFILEEHFKEKKEDIQIIELGGKGELRNEPTIYSIKLGFGTLKGKNKNLKLLVILDKDESLEKTKREIEKFKQKISKKVNKEIKINHLILPGENSKYSEMEGYLFDRILGYIDKQEIKDCLFTMFPEGTPKRDKRLFYCYIWTKYKESNCKYEGTSLNEDLKKCLPSALIKDKNKLQELTSALDNFLT